MCSFDPGASNGVGHRDLLREEQLDGESDREALVLHSVRAGVDGELPAVHHLAEPHAFVGGELWMNLLHDRVRWHEMSDSRTAIRVRAITLRYESTAL